MLGRGHGHHSLPITDLGDPKGYLGKDCKLPTQLNNHLLYCLHAAVPFYWTLGKGGSGNIGETLERHRKGSRSPLARTRPLIISPCSVAPEVPARQVVACASPAL